MFIALTQKTYMLPYKNHRSYSSQVVQHVMDTISSECICITEIQKTIRSADLSAVQQLVNEETNYATSSQAVYRGVGGQI